MYGQVVTCSPSRSALTTRKNSRYWEREGSSSSAPSAEHDCQSTNNAAQRPGSGYGSRPSGRRRDGRRVGPVLDHEEVADVVPRRRRDERGAALGRARDGEAAQRHRRASRRRRQELAEGLAALPLPLDRDRVEAEVRARRQRPPRVRRVAVVRVYARHVVVLRAAPCRSRARRSTPLRRSGRSSRRCRRSRDAPGPNRASARAGRGGRAGRASCRCRRCRRRGGGNARSPCRRAPSRGGRSRRGTRRPRRRASR